MKNFNFVPKDVQRILSSHKVSEKYNEEKVFTRKLFLKMSQYSQQNTCVGISFLIKLQANPCLQLYLKKTPTQEFSCEY